MLLVRPGPSEPLAKSFPDFSGGGGFGISDVLKHLTDGSPSLGLVVTLEDSAAQSPRWRKAKEGQQIDRENPGIQLLAGNLSLFGYSLVEQGGTNAFGQRLPGMYFLPR